MQAVLLSAVRSQLRSAKGPLGAAGQAYGSGNILHAALVTFVVNYFLGTIAMISLPSMILPGIGIVVALVRSLLWGLLLAPTSMVLASSMLPHSGTMLLEGEGYILATIFALLIPIHLVSTRQTGSRPGPIRPRHPVEPPGPRAGGRGPRGRCVLRGDRGDPDDGLKPFPAMGNGQTRYRGDDFR